MSAPYYLIESNGGGRYGQHPRWLTKIVAGVGHWSYGVANAKRYKTADAAVAQHARLCAADRLSSTVAEHMDVDAPLTTRQQHSGDDLSYAPLVQQAVTLVESAATASLMEEAKAAKTLLALEREMHAVTMKERNALRDAVLAHRAAIRAQRDAVSSWGAAAKAVVDTYAAVTEAVAACCT